MSITAEIQSTSEMSPYFAIATRALVCIYLYNYVTGFGKTGLIAGYVKIDFILEKASTKFKYCLRKI